MNMLEGKVVVVTGAGSGVGRGLAAGFCRDGAQVVGIGRTEADLEETARTYGQGRMSFVVGDVSSAEDVERLFAKAEADHGRVDILINNAAVYPKERFLDSDLEAFQRALLINVMGVAHTCHRALPGMIERGFGRVVNIGSYAFRGPVAGAAIYSASKGAVDVLTRALAVEIVHPNVRINQLMPGIYRTRMTPDQGDDPMTAYPHCKVAATVSDGGPHGQTFLLSELVEEAAQGGLRAKLRNAARRWLGR
jgi:NAD(P)-dependent dehydrogenase (short-subunit alcohol dehydrogenase family)